MQRYPSIRDFLFPLISLRVFLDIRYTPRFDNVVLALSALTRAMSPQALVWFRYSYQRRGLEGIYI